MAVASSTASTKVSRLAKRVAKPRPVFKGVPAMNAKALLADILMTGLVSIICLILALTKKGMFDKYNFSILPPGSTQRFKLFRISCVYTWGPVCCLRSTKSKLAPCRRRGSMHLSVHKKRLE